MTRAVAAVVTWLSLLTVLVVAGVYTVAYLFSWQWMRAQIAGLAFVAALVVACTLAVMARLRRLERRLDGLSGVVPPAPSGEAPAGIEPRPDFRWLSAPTSAPVLLGLPLLDRLRPPDDAVFIPVFLATGLVVAGLASVVERISALRHGGSVAVAVDPRPAPARSYRTPRPFVLVPLVSAAVVAAVLGGLWRTTHYRSEPLGPGITTMTVDVDRSSAGEPGVPDVTRHEAVALVGRYCSVGSGVAVRFVGVAPGPAGTTLLRVSPLLDAAARERFAGCVQDAVLDRHSMAVVAIDLTPE